MINDNLLLLKLGLRFGSDQVWDRIKQEEWYLINATAYKSAAAEDIPCNAGGRHWFKHKT